MQQTRSRFGLVFTVVLTILTWAAVAFVFLQRQAIIDWWRLRDYTPPAEIVSIANDTTLNERGRHLFYVYHPVVEQASSFNENCTTNNEYSIILGCYVSGQGIYVFKVDDPRLAGVQQVTAAHELLHAAYERLSKSERADVDAQLAAVYKTVTDERLRQTIEQYRKADPSVVPNELHSILGTELRTLTPELEAYYKRYFTNRLAVVGFSEQYEKAFSDRKAQIESLEGKLKSMQEDVTSRTAALRVTAEQLSADYRSLETQRNQLPPSQFNALATAYNSRVTRYNQEVSAISALIDRYNDTYKQYQQYVTERQDLYKAISSRPEALPTQ